MPNKQNLIGNELMKKTHLIMRLRLVSLFGLCAITIFASTAFAQAVDEDIVIVANGNILTMNPDQPTASAMAVKDGKILAVGNLSAV